MKMGSNVGVNPIKMLTPEKQYVVFWGIVELVAIAPFYYGAWKLHKAIKTPALSTDQKWIGWDA